MAELLLDTCALIWAMEASLPASVIASSFLPGQPPRDPFDRILAATARAHEMTLMTRDRSLLAYAAAGHLSAVPC